MKKKESQKENCANWIIQQQRIQITWMVSVVFFSVWLCCLYLIVSCAVCVVLVLRFNFISRRQRILSSHHVIACHCWVMAPKEKLFHLPLVGMLCGKEKKKTSRRNKTLRMMMRRTVTTTMGRVRESASGDTWNKGNRKNNTKHNWQTRKTAGKTKHLNGWCALRNETMRCGAKCVLCVFCVLLFFGNKRRLAFGVLSNVIIHSVSWVDWMAGCVC